MNLNPGNLKIGKYLIENGACITARNYEGKTALDIASKRGNMTCQLV